MGLRVKVHRAMKIVVACMLLHNAALAANDTDPPGDEELVNGRHVYEDVPAPQHGQDRHASTAVRTALINNYFAH